MNVPSSPFVDRYSEVAVAVLGAAGFIGRWTARCLTSAGAHLHLAVRNETDAAIFESYGIRGTTVLLDLTCTDALQTWLAHVRPAVVFNLAGYGVSRSERDEYASYRINADLITDLCASIAKYRNSSWTGQSLIHVGSALEYGPISGDLSENSAPNPTTLYGQSKLAGTLNLRRESEARNLRAVTARLFTVYGPGEQQGRLLPSLLEAAQTGREVLLSAGTQQRDFTYVEDVAAGLLRLGICDSAGLGEIVNLASGHLHSVREFSETAAALLNMPQRLLRFGTLQLRPEEMSHDNVNNTRLEQLTGWSPDDDLAAGISKTIQFTFTTCGV